MLKLTLWYIFVGICFYFGFEYQDALFKYVFIFGMISYGLIFIVAASIIHYQKNNEYDKLTAFLEERRDKFDEFLTYHNGVIWSYSKLASLAIISAFAYYGVIWMSVFWIIQEIFKESFIGIINKEIMIILQDSSHQISD